MGGDWSKEWSWEPADPERRGRPDVYGSRRPHQVPQGKAPSGGGGFTAQDAQGRPIPNTQPIARAPMQTRLSEAPVPVAAGQPAPTPMGVPVATPVPVVVEGKPVS